MPYINVNDVYILDNTGKQVDDSVDYANANSNRNLLDNPWWGSGEVVNQRGITAKPSNGSYGIDRWVFTSGADANTISLGTSGITFNISSSYIWMVQRFPNVAAWSGKTLTASILFSNGTVKSGSKPFTLGTAVNFFEDSTVALTMNTSGYFSVSIKTTSTIRAVKLELGSYSTLANDVPPDYWQELDKCLWYFERIKARGGYSCFGSGVAASATIANILVPMHPKRNNSYTIATSGTFGVIGGTVTSMAKDNASSNCALNLAVTGTFTSGAAVLLRSQNDANAYIDVNNDL